MTLWRRLVQWIRRLVRPDSVYYIGSSDTLPPPLTRQEEAEILERLPGEAARQTLIERNLRLVVYIAKRFDNTGINIEDLISIGTIGLIKAVNTFRTDKNIKLATYASRCIENEILMYLRKNSNTRTEVSFDEPLNTDWDGKELLLSDVMGTEEDVVMRPLEEDVDRQLLHSAVAKLSPREQDIISLRFGLGGRKELLLSDVMGTEEDVVMRPLEEDVDRQLLHSAVAKLSPREQDIISLRFGLGGRKELTQKEVADQLGISQSYISRLEKRIILRLRREIMKMA